MRSRRSTSRLAIAATVIGQLRVAEPLANLLRLRLLAFAELVLNRLELLAQVVLPLRVVISCSAADSILPFNSSSATSRLSASATAFSLVIESSASRIRCFSSALMSSRVAST